MRSYVFVLRGVAHSIHSSESSSSPIGQTKTREVVQAHGRNTLEQHCSPIQAIRGLGGAFFCAQFLTPLGEGLFSVRLEGCHTGSCFGHVTGADFAHASVTCIAYSRNHVDAEHVLYNAPHCQHALQ